MTKALGCMLSVICLVAQSASLLEQADSAFRNGDLDRSLALARQVLDRDPRALHAHLIVGVIAAQRKDWGLSTRHFETVVRLQPSNAYGYFYLGQAKLYQQDWSAAIRFFLKALEREYPDRARLLIELALAQNEAGQPEQALKNLAGLPLPAEKDLAAQYYAVTAFTQGKLNRPAAAIEAIRRALQYDDTNTHSWEFLIATLIKTDDAPQALAEAIRAQKKFPDDAGIQYLFALASYHVTESPLSRLALRNLQEADPKDPRVLLAEGLLARKQGRIEEALAAFQKAAQSGVQDARLLLGIVHKENGQYDAAEREYREAARLNPQNGQVMLELGKLLLARGQLGEARASLENAARFMPDGATVHYQLGLLYRRLGQVEKAQEHFQRSKQPDAETKVR